MDRIANLTSYQTLMQAAEKERRYELKEVTSVQLSRNK